MPRPRCLNKYAITSNSYWSNRWNDFMIRNKNKSNIKELQINWLNNVLKAAQRYYYNTGKSLMSDGRFDIFEERLKKFTDYNQFDESTWHEYFKRVGH